MVSVYEQVADLITDVAQAKHDILTTDLDNMDAEQLEKLAAECIGLSEAAKVIARQIKN